MGAAPHRRPRLAGCNGSDEDVLTHAMFPQVAPKFFKSRAEGPKNVGADPGRKLLRPSPHEPKPQANGKPRRPEAAVNYVITLNGKEHRRNCRACRLGVFDVESGRTPA